MKLTCLNCGHEFDGTISKDALGPHSVCPECDGSFDVWGFNDDEEKMIDFRELSKEEFLQSYSYLTEDEYDITKTIEDLKGDIIMNQKIINQAQKEYKELKDFITNYNGTPISLLDKLQGFNHDEDEKFFDVNYGKYINTTVYYNKDIYQLSDCVTIWNGLDSEDYIVDNYDCFIKEI